jgi:hypothetical protein
LSPLPEQQPSVTAEDPPDERFYVRMVAHSAGRRIVKDIAEGAAMFRWTGAEPSIELRVSSPGPWLARMEFAVAEATLRETGPVTVRLFLNDQLLGQQQFRAPGESTLSFPVPDELLAAAGTARLRAQIEPVWVAPDDGARLGVLLKAMGFVRP